MYLLSVWVGKSILVCKNINARFFKFHENFIRYERCVCVDPSLLLLPLSEKLGKQKIISPLRPALSHRNK